jgi:tetratricopeptide (TPR) repeat protein
MNQDLSVFAQDSAAAGVLRGLAEGRWRKARDLAKDLCKKDRVRYLPLLIEANVGLARELLGKGLVKDAETVVAYLKTIAPAEVVAALEKELAAPPVVAAGSAESAPARAGSVQVHFLTLWPDVLTTAGALVAGKPVKSRDWAAVDAAVTCYQTPPAAEAGSLAERVKAELALVHEAVAATGDGRWEDAQRLLRGLERQSVFQQWRMFLRGVRHHFLREAEAARKCFATLPADGALVRSARVVAGAEAVPGTPRQTSARVCAAWWLAVSGERAALAAPLAEAQDAWAKGEWKRAYDLLCKGMGKEFPSFHPGLAGLLSDVMCPTAHPVSPMELKRDKEMVKHFSQPLLTGEAGQRMVRGLLRALVTRDAAAMHPHELTQEWSEFVKLETHFNGRNDVRDSIAWQWLGEQQMTERRQMTLLRARRGPNIKSGAHAHDALNKAVKCDPDNEGAYLALLRLHTLNDDKPSRNRLLDDLVRRFPGNKEMQMQAGVLAAERKAFGKALTYLRAALALDPLDTGVKAALALALADQARELGKKKKSAEAVWQEMEPLLQAAPGGGIALSRWSMRLRRGLMEGRGGLLEEARALAPSQIQCLMLEQMLVNDYKMPPSAEWGSLWKAALAGDALSWRGLHEMMEMLVPNKDKRMHWQAMMVLKKLVGNVAKMTAEQHLETDADGLLEFTAFWLQRKAREASNGDLLQFMYEVLGCVGGALAQFLKKARRKEDPRLRLAALLLWHKGYMIFPIPDPVKWLGEVIKDAQTQGMTQVEERAKKLALSLYASDGGMMDDEDDGDEDEDEDGDGDGDVFVDEEDFDGPPMPADMPAELKEFLMDLVAAVMSGNKDKVRELRTLALIRGVPTEKIDEIIALMSPYAPGGGSGKKRRAQNAQLDLF